MTPQVPDYFRRYSNLRYDNATTTTTVSAGDYGIWSGTNTTAFDRTVDSGIEGIASIKTRTLKEYYDKIMEFPSFEECMKKFNELRFKHSKLSKYKSSEWTRKRTSNISKDMQMITGALNIYSGSIKGFTNKK